MTVVRTIGVGTGLNVTPNHSSINGFDSYMNGLGTFTQDVVGRVLWNSSANELAVGGQILDGSTPSTFAIILEAGDADGNAGGSFRDHANRLTNPLRYDPTVGACIKNTSGSSSLLGMLDPNITIRNLQFNKAVSLADVINANSADAGKVIDSCIITATGNISVSVVVEGPTAAFTVKNSLIYISDVSAGTICLIANAATSIFNNTIALTDPADTTSSGIIFNAGASTARNNATYGFPSLKDWKLNGGTVSGDCNATSRSSGTSNLSGTNKFFDMVGTTEFQSVTQGSEDFRLKSTSVKCRDLGTATGTPTLDIIGQTRV